MSETAQLALKLEHRPALGRADFLVADSNRQAVAWIDRTADWPRGVLALHGPAGSGKTHLASVWQGEFDAAWLQGESVASLDPTEVMSSQKGLVIDDAAALAVNHSEELLHLINWVREEDQRLLLVDEVPPARWPVTLPDLSSRLGALQVVALGAPDDALMAALMVKLFADRQLAPAPELLRYLLPRIERSFVAIQEVVQRLDQASLAARREITIPLAREALGLGGND